MLTSCSAPKWQSRLQLHMTCSLKSAIPQVLLLFLIQSFQIFLERLNFNINSTPLKILSYYFLSSTAIYYAVTTNSCTFTPVLLLETPIRQIKIIPVPAQPPKNTNNGSLMMVASKQLPWNLWIVFLWTILLSFPVFPISKFAISTF